MTDSARYVLWLSELGQGDVARVGGKNASLGEMIQRLAQAGVSVPEGFATTAQAYRDFLAAHDLVGPVRAWLERYERRKVPLARAGAAIRGLFLERELPPAIAEAIAAGYGELGQRIGRPDPDVAVRSSATAEDLPEASFAGQQETFLNVRGRRALLDACRRCLASLFTDRAIAYREAHGFDHLRVALSVGVQRMVRSDRAGAGVMFSIDTETGFPDVVLINAAWGLGETVVQGSVDPDEYMVFKPLLRAGVARPIVHRRLGAKARKLVYGRARGHPTRLATTPTRDRRRYVLADAEVLQLARWAVTIEEHYGRPMDMEWAKDGITGELTIVQARPETVQSRREAGALKSYTLRRKGRRLLTGLSIGDAVAAGPVARLDRSEQMTRFPSGGVLVTAMTDPDWVPIMRRAAAIVTDHGGRTSHAAIVSRELGLPAIVGTGQGTRILKDGQAVTVSCAEGDQGFVYEGIADFEARDVALEDVPKTRTQVMLNLGNPAGALRWWRLPSDGVGLARIEFIIGNLVRIHPLALTRFRELTDRRARRQIEALTAGYRDKRQYFVDMLAGGVARIAAAQYPRPVIVRMSDFKTNEYAELIGGRQFEPAEENPMLGWRGASRYASPEYRDGFALECQAVRKVREEMGLTNVIVMIPFCRTLGEADATLQALAAHGLRRGERGLEVYVMCEIPSNVILAADFAERFDGFSIGSNDLTQLTLGVDRDSARLAHLFDEDDPAVRRLIAEVIGAAHRAGRKVGLCGQAPSDRPAFARFLVEAGIDSISVSPDSFLQVKQHVAAAEREGER
jgi:pyruvate,water dikinase